MQKFSLVLFDQNLRLEDNPPLFYALQKEKNILPLFIFDEKNKRKLGGASKWFLHHSLEIFSKELREKLGLKLIIKKGDSLEILTDIFNQIEVKNIYLNNLYEPFNIKLQNQIKNLAEKKNIPTLIFKSYLLFEPHEIKNQSGSYFKVFTPFWKECLKNFAIIEEPLAEPKKAAFHQENLLGLKVIDLKLTPTNPNWTKNFEKVWPFDYQKIISNFEEFLQNNIINYKEDRNHPGDSGTSRLSPYLHFGLISPRKIVSLIKNSTQKNRQKDIDLNKNGGVANFLIELGWREFAHHLLFHFPTFETQPFKKEFAKFKWDNNENLLKKWQQGKTGYPIVDAAMKELWTTGWMHNRARMIVASFLIKDLFAHWKKGEEWFWDCLVDANLASNVSGWQWVFGSGADGLPFFRIFNPVLQGERFDPQGKYVKKWLPELSKIPDKFIHKPWELSEMELLSYEITLGKNYPNRIVIHEESKKEALKRFRNLK